jgi:hypothetical protein
VVVPVIWYGLLLGKVAEAGAVIPSGPTGPTILWSTAPVWLGQPAEVVELMAVVSVPDPGETVREPREPCGTAALATPFIRNAEAVVTAATVAPDTSRITNLFLFTSTHFYREIGD